MREFIFLRALVHRLGIQRADLQYCKLFLGMQVADLCQSQNVTLSYIRDLGLASTMENDLSARRKFVRCVQCVIACVRMRILARNWRNVVDECEGIQ